MASVRHRNSRLLRAPIYSPSPILWAVLAGLGLGVVGLIAGQVSAKWQLVLVGSVMTLPAVFVLKDIRRLILVVFCVDVLLGFDIAVQSRGLHRGGPTGYLVSLMTIALVAGYGTWALEQKPRLRLFPQVTIPALLYLSTSVLSLFQSRDLQLSAFGLFLRCQVFLMYFYVVNHLRTPSDVRLVVTTFVVCLLLAGTLMILQYFTGVSLRIANVITSSAIAEDVAGIGVMGARVSGTLDTPSSAALFLEAILFLALVAYLSGGKWANSGLAMGAFGLGIIGLIVTASRGGWFAFSIVMLPVVARLLWTPGRKRLPLLLAIGLLIGILFAPQIVIRITITEGDQVRGYLDAMARNLIEAYPLGLGENTYELFMSDKYAHPAMVGHTHLSVHNRYLMVWTETGLHGLIAFALLLGAAIWQARWWLFDRRVSSDLVLLGTGVLGAFLAFLVHMRFENFNGRPQDQLLWLIIALLTVIGWLAKEERRQGVSRIGDIEAREQVWVSLRKTSW